MVSPNPQKRFEPDDAAERVRLRRASRPVLAGDSTRRQMIDQTNAFLSWALAEDRDLPRIPRRRVSEGGFTAILKRHPYGRALANRWWARALLDRMG